MIYMDKAILERRLHLTVTFIGGFMGCYAIFNRCDVFGSAQTGNLISFVMDPTDTLIRICFFVSQHC